MDEMTFRHRVEAQTPRNDVNFELDESNDERKSLLTDKNEYSEMEK